MPSLAQRALSYCPAPAALLSENEVLLLQDGAEAFPAMLEAIEQARQTVRLETYIYADDRIGRRFACALIAAARRGVQVSLLYDCFGSWRAGASIFQALAAEGVTVLGFKPLAPWRRGWGWPRRDHRKLLVVDGCVGFTGGINISALWAKKEEGGAGWRDTMVRVQGPAARELDRLFREVFAREVRRQKRTLVLTTPRTRTLPPALRARPETIARAPVWIVGNREFIRRRAIRRAYRHAIERAKISVLIANPYFIPDHAILRSLRAARRRGVRVALLLPGASDILAVQWASRATYDRLLTWGVQIYHWPSTVFHAKTAVVDASWATVGSYNLDTQSLRYNLEVTAVFPDPAVATQLERRFEVDAQAGERLHLASWRARPWWWRLPERFFYLFRAWL